MTGKLLFGGDKLKIKATADEGNYVKSLTVDGTEIFTNDDISVTETVQEVTVENMWPSVYVTPEQSFEVVPVFEVKQEKINIHVSISPIGNKSSYLANPLAFQQIVLDGCSFNFNGNKFNEILGSNYEFNIINDYDVAFNSHITSSTNTNSIFLYRFNPYKTLYSATKPITSTEKDTFIESYPGLETQEETLKKVSLSWSYSVTGTSTYYSNGVLATSSPYGFDNVLSCFSYINETSASKPEVATISDSESLKVLLNSGIKDLYFYMCLF